jgi:hypothetical protein
MLSFCSFNFCGTSVDISGAPTVPNLAYRCLAPQAEVAVIIDFLHIGTLPFQSGE